MAAKKDPDDKLSKQAKQLWNQILLKKGLLATACDGDLQDAAKASRSGLVEAGNGFDSASGSMLGTDRQNARRLSSEGSIDSNSDEEASSRRNKVLSSHAQFSTRISWL